MRYFLRCGSLFCYEESYRNPRQCLGCQCELFVVCVYVFCFYGRETPTLRLSHCRAVHSVTLCPVETMQAHQKHTIPARALRGFFHLGQLCAYGGPGGIRTPVQNTFLSASYSNNLQYIFILEVCQ